jgi:hypothetical protein
MRRPPELADRGLEASEETLLAVMAGVGHRDAMDELAQELEGVDERQADEEGRAALGGGRWSVGRRRRQR